MLYGVAFGEWHSFRDWQLLLSKRPEISPPSPKTNYIDIPGGDGSLDLTESLTGDVQYGTRAIKFTFATIKPRRKWADLYSDIQDCIHGQRMKVIMDEDPSFYYIGRAAVNSWESSEKYSTVVVDAEVEPYKYERASSMEAWEWDSFNFETGIIREYGNLAVDGELDLEIMGRRKKVIPSFTVNSEGGEGLEVSFEGAVYRLPDGTSRILNIATKEGSNMLHFTGRGVVSVDYRGGRL
ncbi:MAG TPA: mtfA protein [Lachnospiraceae bacterium]|nr:mtfA protein [Lachnospiraceae bacterium]